MKITICYVLHCNKVNFHYTYIHTKRYYLLLNYQLLQVKILYLYDYHHRKVVVQIIHKNTKHIFSFHLLIHMDFFEGILVYPFYFPLNLMNYIIYKSSFKKFRNTYIRHTYGHTATRQFVISESGSVRYPKKCYPKSILYD